MIFVRQKILVLLALLVIASTVAGIRPTHAGGYPTGAGTVCLTDPSGLLSSPASAGDPCQTSPYVFNGPYPASPQPGPTQIRVGVYINGSNAIGGFTVVLNATHTVLAAAGVDLTGSVLQQGVNPPNIFAECLSGVAIKGPSCPPVDGPDTLDLSAGVAIGSGNTPAPTTGLLFTAIFNVTGVAPSGGIPILFQSSSSFCSTAATSSTVAAGQSGNYCVSVSEPPATNPLPEFAQVGTLFDNSACATTCNLPWVAANSNVTGVGVVQGASSGNHVSITATAESGWPGSSTDSINFTAVAPTGFPAPTFGGAGFAVCSPTGSPACPVVLTISTTTAGSYTVTVYGKYVSVESSGATVTLIGTVSIQVNIGGVIWKINGVAASSTQTMFMAKGPTNPLTLYFHLQSVGEYTGTITYSTQTLVQDGTGAVVTYPPSFTLPADGSVSSKINVTATSYGTTGGLDILYKALTTASGGLSVPVSGVLKIFVTGVGIATNSTSVSFVSESSANVMLTLSSLPPTIAGYAGVANVVVGISGPSGFGQLGVACPSSPVVPAGGTVSGNCVFSGSLAGTYTATINIFAGTNNTITNSTSVTATITPGASPGVNVVSSPPSVTLNANVKGNSTITITSRNSFSGSISLGVIKTGVAQCTLNQTIVPPPFTFTLTSTANIQLSCIDSAAQTVNATLTISTGPTTNPTVINATSVTYVFQDFTNKAGPSALTQPTAVAGASTITIGSSDGFSGTVTLSLATNSTNLSCNLSSTSITGGSGTSMLSCMASVLGNYQAIVIGKSSLLGHNSTVTYYVHAFNITAIPTTVNAKAAIAATSTITIIPLGSFAAIVSLTVASDSGLNCGLSPTSVTGGSGTSTLSCASNSASTYTANVTGTSGSASYFVTVKFVVTGVPPPDFTVSASPTSVSVSSGATGSSTQSTITVAPLNNFVGTVTLSVVENSTNLSCSLSSTGIPLSSGTSTLSCTATVVGNYAANVTGRFATLAHAAVVTYHVQDFAVSAGPTTASANTGAAGTSTVTVSALNGFSGTVTLGVTGNATSLICTLTPTSVTGAGTSSLSCTDSTAGHYLATVTAASGSLSHRTNVTYTITATTTPGSNSNILGLSPTVFYGLIGAIIAVIAIVSVLVLRRRGGGATVPATAPRAAKKP